MNTINQFLTKDSSLDSVIVIGIGFSLAFDLAYLTLFNISIYFLLFALLRIFILVDYADPKRPSFTITSKLGSIVIFSSSLFVISYGVFDHYHGNILEILQGLISISIFSEFPIHNFLVFLGYFIISLIVLLYFLIKLALLARNAQKA